MKNGDDGMGGSASDSLCLCYFCICVYMRAGSESFAVPICPSSLLACNAACTQAATKPTGDVAESESGAADDSTQVRAVCVSVCGETNRDSEHERWREQRLDVIALHGWKHIFTPKSTKLHTSIHVCMHPCIQVCIYVYICTYMRATIYAYVYGYVHIYVNACMQSFTHTHAQTSKHTWGTQYRVDCLSQPSYIDTRACTY